MTKHDAFSQMSEAEIARWIKDALTLPDHFGSTDERFKHSNLNRTWSLGPVIRNRDSGLTDQSNAAVLERLLESDPSLADTWEIFGSSHWACGWVDHMAFLVVDDDGKPTKTAAVIKGFYDDLADTDDGPYADRDDYVARAHEALCENIRNLHGGTRCLRPDVPDSWVEDIIQYFEKNDRGAIEDNDDQGGCPSDDEFETAARALGFWDESDD